MTAKDFLQQVYIAHGELEMTFEKINQMQALATKTTTTLKSVPCGSNAVGSKIEGSVIAMQEQIERLADEIRNFLSIQEKVSETINHMENPVERIILGYRYLCFFTWQQIALIMKLSVRQILRIHDQALKNFLACH